MEVGIAYDLRKDFSPASGAPEDRLEEYDSEETVEAVAEALRANGCIPRRLGGGRRFVELVLEQPPALVFNIAEGHGTRSREAHVPAVCEMLGIPFTHSDPLALALSLDKAMTKRTVAAQGVATPSFAVVESVDQSAGLSLRYPLIAKPLFEGSSMGIRKCSRVADARALRVEVERLLRDYHQPVLVEEFCGGPEFTAGVLGTGREARVVGVMEIRPRRGRLEDFVYSLEVKRNYEEEVEYLVPPQQPRGLVEQVEQVALDAFRALGCRDVARVDVRVGADGAPKFLEINPLPGLNPVTGDLPMLAVRSGMPYTALIGFIVDSAWGRWTGGRKTHKDRRL
ncbi:MAG: ATP-grasp domain-containing protein [Planctomycetota bacterium]|nr:MAG: ATP-grasp domain-containing protein [Planctomycetota bacterium]